MKLPSYRLHRPSQRAVVTLDGRDHYLGPHGTPESRAHYDRLIGEWLANGRRLPRKEPEDPHPGPTVAELVVAYVAHAEHYYRKHDSPTREVHGCRMALRPAVEFFAELPALEFGPTALKACREWFLDHDHSRPYANRQVSRIRRAFKWAVGEEMVPPATLAALQAVEGLKRGRCQAREPEPVGPVEEARVEAVLPLVPRQVSAMMRLQALTGMRPGEVVAMRTGDLDRSGHIWLYTPGSHKTEHHGRERQVALGPQAQEVLRPWLRADPGAFLFQPREAAEAHREARRAARRSPMTPSQAKRKRRRKPRKAPGERYSTGSYARAIARACEKAWPPPEALQGAELKAWRAAHRWAPNQLRHSFATRVRREHGLEGAQVALGHARADVTQLYAERNTALAARVAEQIG